MNDIFKNKTILILGATGSIGQEVCKQLSHYECKIIAVGSNLKSINKTKSIIKDGIAEMVMLKCNLDVKKDVFKLINLLKTKYKINILINCAGIFINSPIDKMSSKIIETSFNVNIQSPFMIIKEAIKNMKKNKWGRVVNLGSSSSYSGFNDSSVYCSTKHAILGFTKALHNELKSFNIRCYCISPSSTKGNMGKSTKNQDYNTFLEPQDVAKYIIFTISFDSNLMNEEVFLNRMFIK